MLKRVEEIINEVKALAKEYYSLTGKPLGITGEVAEVEAARLLGLELAEARQPGYDAIRKTGTKETRIQIKGRRVTNKSKTGGRLGSINLKKSWDTVMLVVLDENYDAIEIREALRPDIEDALTAPGSKARNDRGQLAMSKFKAISKVVWEKR